MTVITGTGLKAAQELVLPGSVIAMNIFYFQADFADSQSDQDVVDTIEIFMETLYASVIDELSDEVSLGDMVVYKYNVLLDQWDNIGTGTPTRVGTGVSDMLPHGVSALVRAYSVNSRSIARKYIPGFVEDAQADGVWIGSALTAMADFGDLWTVPVDISVNNTLIPGVFDTTLKLVHEFTQVEVALAEPAYQRRRRPGVGI